MSRSLPHPLLTLFLVLLWVLLTNSPTPGQLAFGLLLGWLIPLLTRRFWPERTIIRHPLVLLRFLLILCYDILVANLQVARLIIRGPKHIQPAFVVVPLEVRSEIGISLLANTISMTPGTVSSWLSPDRSFLVVHGLDVPDPDALVSAIKKRYEAPLRKVFESC